MVKITPGRIAQCTFEASKRKRWQDRKYDCIFIHVC